jgi:trehalose 2-sulfotransferase
LVTLTKPPTKSYILWFTQRVGSTVLAQALIDTGIAGRPQELCNAENVAGIMKKMGTKDGTSLREALWREGTTPNGVFGLKYGMSPALHAELIAMMCVATKTNDTRAAWESFFPNCNHFVLTRRDKVRLAVSWWKLVKTQQGHRRPGEAAVALSDDAYNYRAIHHLVGECQEREDAIWKQLSEWNTSPDTIVYEDLAASFESIVRRVLVRLGFDTSNITLPMPAFERTADALSDRWVERYLNDAARRQS